MFKFNFAIDDDGEHEQKPEQIKTPAESDPLKEATELTEEIRDIPIQELLDALPSIISYSTLTIPISGQDSKVTLARRDLYDVRYQLIAQDDEPTSTNSTDVLREEVEKATIADGLPHKNEAELSYVDNPSDLAPGLYEGGLKTWECSLDLVQVLEGKVKAERGAGWVRGKRIFEVGCGTAVPSLYLLQQLFQEPPGQEESTIVLQDFNDLVLRLVTFPNVFLTWYTSPLAEHLRAEQDAPSTADSEDITVTITQALKDAFLQSIKERNISLQFIAGSWDAVLNTRNLLAKPYDVVLTSETIYRTASLPSLISLLRRACGSDGGRIPGEDDLAAQADRLSLRSDVVCLVAAKILYFGVGGGIIDFENMVRKRGGSIDVVFNKVSGVARRVLSVQWSKQ